MKELVIVGAGDIARLAHSYFARDSDLRVVAFAVDRAYRQADSFLGLPLLSLDELRANFPPCDNAAFVAISYARMNRVRAEKYAQLKAWGYELASYVSSRCTYLSEIPPGDNCFLLEDNTIQPFVRIGNDVTLWSGNHIGHDSTVGDHCFVSSHVVVSGRCAIGPYCFLGVNATLRNGLTLAPRTLVGAGAVLMEDTIEGGVYVPPRAQRLGRSSDEVKL